MITHPDVIRAFADRPVLGKVYAAIAGEVGAVAGRAIGVHGSVARGEVDRFSDLDLIVWAAPDESVGEVAGQVRVIAHGIGDVLTSFSGSHIGRPGLVITYSLLDGEMVKTDVEVIPAACDPEVEYFIILAGPACAHRLDVDSSADCAALAIQLDKAAGWAWFTYAKIARGEYFAAARSIDFTREHALLPALLYQHGLPQDGHRHVEARLPAAVVERLRRSHPASLDTGELMRACDELNAYLLAVISELGNEIALGNAGENLSRMCQMVADAEAEFGSGAAGRGQRRA